jgi:hypothetical protein
MPPGRDDAAQQGLQKQDCNFALEESCGNLNLISGLALGLTGPATVAKAYCLNARDYKAVTSSRFNQSLTFLIFLVAFIGICTTPISIGTGACNNLPLL